MTEALVSMRAYGVAIPTVYRRMTAMVFHDAAGKGETQMFNGNWALARPTEALHAALGAHFEAWGYSMWWVQPVFYDVLGMSPRDQADWERFTPVKGTAMVLRAIAHAIELGDF